MYNKPKVKFLDILLKLKVLIEEFGIRTVKKLFEVIDDLPLTNQVTQTIQNMNKRDKLSDRFWLLFVDLELETGFQTGSYTNVKWLLHVEVLLLYFLLKRASPLPEINRKINQYMKKKRLDNNNKLGGTKKYKPHEVAGLFYRLKPNKELLNKLWRRHQKEYIRRRLRAIKYLWEGMSQKEVLDKLSLDPSTLNNWLKTLVEYGVEEGLKLLVQSKRILKEGKLTLRQECYLLYILDNQSPNDFGYYQNIFTAKILVEITKTLFDVEVCAETIRNILNRHDYSYQCAHRDYENADKKAQRTYVRLLESSLLRRRRDEIHIFFDEFSARHASVAPNRPTLFRGWAKKNTRFKVPSNEKNRKRTNGFLSVDAQRGDLYIEFSDTAECQDVADYLYNLVERYANKGYRKITIILDNHSTHKDTMRQILRKRLNSSGELSKIEVEFMNTPAYSPDFNLAEYMIHQLRLQLLHHLPSKTTLPEMIQKIFEFLQKNRLQTPRQIKNTIDHILKLGRSDSGI